jgi:hypothetical protein
MPRAAMPVVGVDELLSPGQVGEPVGLGRRG